MKTDPYIYNICSYFRQSLIDSELVSPSDNEIEAALPSSSEEKKETKKGKESDLIAFPFDLLKQGQVGDAVRNRVFGLENVASEGKRETPESLQDLEVVLYPRVDKLHFEGGARSTFQTKYLVPLVVFAKLDPDGQLKPIPDKPPWIPRTWLAPNVGQDPAIGESEAVDAFLSRNTFESVTEFSELLAYCDNLLQAVSGTSLESESILEDYIIQNHSLIQMDSLVVGASKNIQLVYEKILAGDTPSQLFQRFVSPSDHNLEPVLVGSAQGEIKKQHLAQMTDAFPLANRQRIALHHALNMKPAGELLAVNGPPGTGKTTLIRSIVANAWVEAAIQQSEPPVIVATSNNNQAVTNILEDFARIEEQLVDRALQGRWIPELCTYGLYLPSNSKADESCVFPYHSKKGQGLMAGLQMKENLSHAEDFFKACYAQWSGHNINNISECCDHLHRALRDIQAQITGVLERLNRFNQVKTKLFAQCEGEKEAIALVEKLHVRYQHEKQALDQTKALRNQFRRQVESRPFWVVLLGWLPAVKARNQLGNTCFIDEHNLSSPSASDQDIGATLDQMVARQQDVYKEMKAVWKAYSEALANYQHAREDLTNWVSGNPLEKLFSKGLSANVDEIIDRKLRFQAFKLATHYWEARWLLETRDFVDNSRKDTKSPKYLLRMYRRFAKLTPCFVSTFYMVPAYFTAGKYQLEVWRDLPQFGAIDLLIVDEAGQALPEVSGASFALAKKAILVGDTDQIEPVWSVPNFVDLANLKRFQLIKDGAIEAWLDSGLMASNGNVMRIAQRQSRYHQIPNLARGLYLTEHRRCYDEIVQYCNDLVYEGVLEPLRGNPKKPTPWPQLGFIHIDGHSDKKGSSRFHQNQADGIALWLTENKNGIENYAREVFGRENLSTDQVLKKAVAVVTPFAAQTKRVIAALNKFGFPGITVGTVHKLQGAERLIVLFSSVYGEGDQPVTKFYDRSKNMLNVAVSRAKDCFIVFGHRAVFGRSNDNSPSSQLMKRLQSMQGPNLENQRTNGKVAL